MINQKRAYTDAFINAISPCFHSNSDFSIFADGIYWETLRDIGDPFETILKETLNQYCKAARFFGDDLKVLFSKAIPSFPSFLFAIAAKLKEQREYQSQVEILQIVGIAYLSLNHFPKHAAIELLIQTIDPDATPKQLTDALIISDEDTPYIPQIIFQDLCRIGENFELHKTSNKQKLIEYRYLVLGTFQIFLKYYFDLLVCAQSDDIAEHIDQIFSELFASLQNVEQTLWASVPNFQIVQVQINHIIEQNKRPYFFKTRLELLKAYNPLIRERDKANDQLLQQQLHEWQALSTRKQVFFLQAVDVCRSKKNVIFLLKQLYTLNRKKFFELEKHVEEYHFRNKYKNLYVLIHSLSAASKKKKSRPIREIPEENLNVYPDIRSWGPHLENFYQQVTMSGALSEKELPVFFQGFAESALQMLREKEITTETSEKFKQTVNGLMEDCVQRSSLNKQEVKIFQNQIDREMQDVEKVDLKQRKGKIDSIGLVLVQAQKKQEEYEQLFRNALPVQLIVNYEGDRITFTIEDIILLPLPNRQKEKLLETYVPSLIPEAMMMAIYNLCLTTPDGPEVTASVYDIGKYAHLQINKLIQLLEPAQGFHHFLEKPIIRVVHNQEMFKMTLREFFSLPLSSQEQDPDEDHFAQHIKYLKLRAVNNHFPVYAYEIIVNNLDKLARVKYTQYFNIFQGNQFEYSKMEAVVGLLKNGGLERLRLPESEK
ncbi:MAG: hypothetical protein HQM14_09660 [SAR324 cluster bacterium]|nr:hypothetical protein [SAR324 cluster bacterium]